MSRKEKKALRVKGYAVDTWRAGIRLNLSNFDTKLI